MWTIRYHGYWIHGYCDHDDCRVQAPDYTIIARRRSLRAAKSAIRRLRASDE